MTHDTSTDFSLSTSYGKSLKRKWRQKLFRKLTKQALPLFLNGRDIISRDPMANGYYELEIKSLMDHWAKSGHGDFLLDIGANIGLSSCQSGRGFAEVHLFEPNPDALHILKVNTRIALGGHNYRIHEYGLGARSEILKLFIPHGNWGGAFIKSAQNAYDDQLLSAKDGYRGFDASNYDVADVRVEPADQVLQSVFQELSQRGLRRGVVKIDVEGYESLVIQALLQTIPASMAVFVIFENWKDATPSQELTSQSTREVSLFHLSSNVPLATGFFSRLRQAFSLWREGIVSRLVPVGDRLRQGTYVMQVNVEAGA